jgi:hypothetical protein
LLSIALADQARGAIADGALITISRSGGASSAAGAYDGTARTEGESLHGGEFRVVAGTGLAQEIFKTFCLEYSETISVPHQYKATVDNGAVLGGLSGSTDNYDSLSNATKWFYKTYRTSHLDALDLEGSEQFAYNNDHWANALQLVFWRLEGEVTATWSKWGTTTPLPGPSSAELTLIKGKADLLWGFYEDNPWINNLNITDVMVLNLWNKNANLGTMHLMDDQTTAGINYRQSLANANIKHQSQLYYTGPAVTSSYVTPEPASIVLWGGFCVAGLLAARRARRK